VSHSNERLALATRLSELCLLTTWKEDDRLGNGDIVTETLHRCDTPFTRHGGSLLDTVLLRPMAVAERVAAIYTSDFSSIQYGSSSYPGFLLAHASDQGNLGEVRMQASRPCDESG
jgi:hypothetical protein